MGRRANETVVYYWYSQSEDKRASWFFPSRKAAETWRNNKYYKYFDFNSLEDYIKTVEPSRKQLEIDIWKRHKDGFNDLIIKIGKIKYN